MTCCFISHPDNKKVPEDKTTPFVYRTLAWGFAIPALSLFYELRSVAKKCKFRMFIERWLCWLLSWDIAGIALLCVIVDVDVILAVQITDISFSFFTRYLEDVVEVSLFFLNKCLIAQIYLFHLHSIGGHFSERARWREGEFKTDTLGFRKPLYDYIRAQEKYNDYWKLGVTVDYWCSWSI